MVRYRRGPYEVGGAGRDGRDGQRRGEDELKVKVTAELSANILAGRRVRRVLRRLSVGSADLTQLVARHRPRRSPT
jgi:hypothetical protein